MNIIRILKKAIYNCRKYLFSKYIIIKCLAQLTIEELIILKFSIDKVHIYLKNNNNFSCSGLCSLFTELHRVKKILSLEEYKILSLYIDLEYPYRGFYSCWFWFPYEWKARKNYIKLLKKQIDNKVNKL